MPPKQYMSIGDQQWTIKHKKTVIKTGLVKHIIGKNYNTRGGLSGSQLMRIMKLTKYRLKAQVEKDEGLSGERKEWRIVLGQNYNKNKL